MWSRDEDGPKIKWAMALLFLLVAIVAHHVYF